MHCCIFKKWHAASKVRAEGQLSRGVISLCHVRKYTCICTYVHVLFLSRNEVESNNFRTFFKKIVTLSSLQSPAANTAKLNLKAFANYDIAASGVFYIPPGAAKAKLQTLLVLALLR